MAENKSKANEFKFKAEMKQLLNLIVHSLYQNPEVFLRELVSNSSDALNKVRFKRLTEQHILNPEEELKIQIELDKENKMFSIEDTGIGMTKEELVSQLGTVASSGTLQFLEKIKAEGKQPDASMIGKFGVGFYSVFMVAEEVFVETRSASPGAKAYKWSSKGENNFTIEEIERKKRGTKIYFKLREGQEEFAEDFRVRSVLTRYSNFVDYPIYLGNEKINTISALWHKNKDQITEEELEEFYKFISNDFQKPLGHLHLNIEGNINFKALLFIPETAPANLFIDTREKTLHLYSSKVFIQDDAQELLPDYLRFIKGVVDTEDLPLNVSREVTQSSPVMTKIKNVISGKILGMLKDWSENDKEKFDKFYKNFGPIFKTGINSDFANRDKIIELLRFETSEIESGKTLSLKDYAAKMDSEQKEIYYLTGEHREIIEKNPNLEYFRKNSIEVLLLTDPVDIFIIPSIGSYEGKQLKSIEKSDIDIKSDDTEEKLNEDETKSLIELFRETLGDKIEDVVESSRLVESPVTLVVGEQGMDPQLEKMMKMMDKDFTSSKRVLEINTRHQLIKNLSSLLSDNKNSSLVKDVIQQLFESAMLLEGFLTSPTDFVKRMNEFMTAATESKKQ